MTTKTQREIQDEIAALKEVKPFVPRFTFFNDDNWAAIDVQIDALSDEWELYYVDYLYDNGDLTDHDRDNAYSAIDWMNGDFDGYENDDGDLIDSPSASWRELAGL